MARQIIVLETLEETAANDTGYRICFWLTVPTARQPFYSNASFVSAVKDGSVTAPELAALQSGAVFEVVEAKRFTGGTTPAQMKTKAVARLAELQAVVDARNPWVSYGTSYDGAVWSNKAVA